MELKPEIVEEGRLWSARAGDWAEVQERFLDPCYQEVLQRTKAGKDDKVLDVGCGAGRFLQLAADRGARVTGLDVAFGMLEIARSRVPAGGFFLGNMESLPFPDDSFDLVTGFNSFSHADDPVQALAEARRVAKPGKPVAVTVWGPTEQGSMRAAVWEVMHSIVGEESEVSHETGEEHVHSITGEDDLVDIVKAAGLTPQESTEVQCEFSYPDTQTLLKGLMSPGPFVEAAARAGEEKVRKALLEVMGRFRTESGGYSSSNNFRVMITAAPIR